MKRILALLFVLIAITPSPSFGLNCEWIFRAIAKLGGQRGPLPIAIIGDPVLRKIAAPVSMETIKTPEFQNFLDSLIATMDNAGGVGIAAPQVSESKRVFVIRENPSDTPLVFINPVLTIVDENKRSNLEGCLSIPGLCGLVSRPKKVQIRYLDRDGNPQDFTAQGFTAIVIQHEFDHLEGILFPDRFRFISLIRPGAVLP